jgi:hypothetical protein
MTATLTSIAFVVAVFAGCTGRLTPESDASPSWSERDACQIQGGKWRPLTGHCARP